MSENHLSADERDKRMDEIMETLAIYKAECIGCQPNYTDCIHCVLPKIEKLEEELDTLIKKDLRTKGYIH